MTDLDAPGGGGDYEKAPKGNLDATGQYFIWTTNLGGNRLDAFIVKIPSGLLGSNMNSVPITPVPVSVPATTPVPVSSPLPEPAPIGSSVSGSISGSFSPSVSLY